MCCELSTRLPATYRLAPRAFQRLPLNLHLQKGRLRPRRFARVCATRNSKFIFTDTRNPTGPNQTGAIFHRPRRIPSLIVILGRFITENLYRQLHTLLVRQRRSIFEEGGDSVHDARYSIENAIIRLAPDPPSGRTPVVSMPKFLELLRGLSPRHIASSGRD